MAMAFLLPAASLLVSPTGAAGQTPKPGAPAVTRTQFSAPTNPALDVTWTAPAAGGLTITGYKAQYRKKAAAGEDPASWTAYSGTLGATATTFNLANLEAGATYEAQVRAVTSEEGEGAWSATGEGTANRPPAASSVSFSGGTSGVGGSFAWHEAPPLGSGAFFSDPDSDALTYSAAAQHPALLGVSLTGAAGSAVLTANLLNQGSSKVTYTARDAYGGSVTRTTTIGITAKTSRSIAENSAAGTAVGAPVTGTPYNGAALTYSLTGKAANSGLFSIESATGQIKVATGATLDYETDDSNREIEYWNGEVFSKFYRGKVNYTVDGNAAAIEVLIVLTDVASPKPGTPAVTRTQFSEPTNPALDVTWTAPSAGGLTITGYKAQYRKKAAAGEDPASWTAYSGTLGATATTFNLANLEAGATYEAQVRAVTSEEGEGAWSATGEGTANRPPAASSVSFSGGTSGVGGSFAWHEAAPLGSGAFFTDADGDALTYSAAAQHPALLGVSLTGAAGNAVLTANLLNQGSSKVTYTARDAYGGSVTRTTTIGITAKTSRSIAENSAAGTAVGGPGDRDALQRSGADLLADGQCGEFGPVRHRVGHRPDQGGHGRGPGLRDGRQPPGDGDLEWRGDRQVLPGQSGVHGRWSRGRNRRHPQGDGRRDAEARRPVGDAHGVQRADQSRPGRDVDGPVRRRADHHRVQGAVPQEGRGGGGSGVVDGLQRHAGGLGHHVQPGESGGGGDVRGAGAGRHQRGGRECVVGHRGGDGQPSAGGDERILQRRHVPCRHHHRLQGDGPRRVGGVVLRRRQRRADVFGGGAASGVAGGQRDRRRRLGPSAGDPAESGVVQSHLHGP